MKRFSVTMLGLIVLSWATGCSCCHSYRSSCVDWNDGCCSDSWDKCGKKCRKRGDCCGTRCCAADCCESYAVGDGCCQTGGIVGSADCSGCAGATVGGTVMGDCANGSCGTSQPTFGGVPIDPSSGWTVQPMPAPASEPIPAPAAGTAPPAASSGSAAGPAASRVSVPTTIIPSSGTRR